jgi:hypothetical protein
MADPNNSGILSASGPFGMEPAETQIGSFLQGTLNIPSWLYDVNKDIAEAMIAAPGQLIDYLGSPTEYGQAKSAQEQAALEAANIMTQVEAGDPLAEIKSEFGPLGEFGGMETGVDTYVDEIATTLAELNITPSTLTGGRGTMVESPEIVRLHFLKLPLLKSKPMKVFLRLWMIFLKLRVALDLLPLKSGLLKSTKRHSQKLRALIQAAK